MTDKFWKGLGYGLILSGILWGVILFGISFADQTFTLGVGSQTFTSTVGTQTVTLGAAAAPSCPSGTYLFAWNGDYGTDTDKGCFTSGGVVKDGTQSGGTLSATYGRTLVGMGITASDQYMTWTVTGGDGINVTDGTLWMDIYVDDVTPTAEITLFESYLDADNYIKLVYTAPGGLTGTYRGNGIGKLVPDTEDMVIGWNTVGYSWQRTGTDKHSVKMNASAWVEETESAIFEGTPTSITIGENLSGGAHTDVFYIDNVYILTGYQTAHP